MFESDYNGTFDPLVRGQVSRKTGKELRGKARVGKRKPRVASVGGTVKSYYLDADGNKTNVRVFATPARTRQAARRSIVQHREDAQARRIRLLTSAGIIGNIE